VGAGRAKAVAAAACLAVLLVVGGAGAKQAARAATLGPCAFSQTEIWLGDGDGGGAAGHVYLPVELSNIGHSSCTLYGFPGVSAVNSSGHQIGGGGTRSGPAGPVVRLAPGATAHALLAIADWGAICARGVPATGIRIYAPGQRSSQLVQFQFEVCASRSVLSVGPVRGGVGIPGYTNS
jgi:hypothetical protein